MSRIITLACALAIAEEADAVAPPCYTLLKSTACWTEKACEWGRYGCVQKGVSDNIIDCTTTADKTRCESLKRNCCRDPNGEGDSDCMPFGKQCIHTEAKGVDHCVCSGP
jgi:hypothetical protein